MEGFNWIAVVSVWGAVIVLVIVISMTRHFLMKKNPPSSDYVRVEHNSVLA